MIERINSHLVVPISDLIEYAMSYGNVEALKYHTLKDGLDVPIDIMIKSTKFKQDWSLEYQNYILPLFYSKIPDLHIRSIISSSINTNNWISILNYALKNGYYKKEDKDIIKQIINQPFWSWIDNEYQKPFDQWCKLTQVTF